MAGQQGEGPRGPRAGVAMGSAREPEFWPLRDEHAAFVAIACGDEVGGKLLRAMGDYFLHGTEPPDTLPDGALILFDLLRPKLDEDREAVLAGTFTGEDSAWRLARYVRSDAP